MKKQPTLSLRIHQIPRCSSKLWNEAGSVLLPIAFAMGILAAMGIALLQLHSADQHISVNRLSKARAHFAAISGIEYAKFKYQQGASPEVTTPMSLGNATFQVTHNSATRQFHGGGTCEMAKAKVVYGY